MMRLLLPLVLLLVGIGGGVGAGFMMGGGDVATAPEESDGAADDGDGAANEQAAADGEGDAENGDDDHSGADAGPGEPQSVEPTGAGTEYVRLNNQFIVPIVRNGSVRSLVVMSLSVEVDIGQSGAVFNREPRLRDGFLRVMFAHANAGGFDGIFTEASAMEPFREALREAARGTLNGATVHDVLITDITRQDA